MNRSDAKKVIKNLQNKPFICCDNEIIVSGGYVILKEETYKRLRKEGSK